MLRQEGELRTKGAQTWYYLDLLVMNMARFVREVLRAAMSGLAEPTGGSRTTRSENPLLGSASILKELISKIWQNLKQASKSLS